MGAQSPYNNQRENGEPCPQTGLKEAVPLHEIPALIIDLTIILVIAAGTTLLCKKIHLPSVLGYILAGFLAGPVVDFLPTIQDRGGIEVWSDIGVIFLMFGLGLEFSLHKLAEVGGPGLLSAGIQAAGMGGVGVLLGLALGWGPMNSLFLGVMLAMSSTMITMKNVEDLGMKEEKFAGLAMGTLVIEDLLAIFAMVVLSTIAVSQSISGWALAQRIGLLVLSLALWLILGIYLVPTLMKKLVGLMNDEVLLVFSLGLCFLMALLAAAPAVILFQASPLWMSVAALPVIWMATHSDRLAGRYLEVEARFLANFNERKLAQRFGQGEEEVHLWLTQQLYVIPLVCPPDWAQGGKTLHDLDWGRRDHVSVLKVRRGQTHWNIPEGNVALAGGDQLVVMGSQRQVENFCLQRAEEGLMPAGELVTLKDYIASQQDIPEAKQLLCCGVSLDKTMPQAGKSVRDSGIKGDWSALLIGLERDLLPIPSPDPSLTLRDGDLLWVMGSQEMAGKLLRLGLLD